MTAAEWTNIGIFATGLIVSLLVYIVQFLHKMDKRGAVDTAKLDNHEQRITTLETTTGDLKSVVTRLEAKQ
jgi:hypothetical protein